MASLIKIRPGCNLIIHKKDSLNYFIIPPPIIVIPPSWVFATTESIKALVPFANASNSNTPAGL